MCGIPALPGGLPGQTRTVTIGSIWPGRAAREYHTYAKESQVKKKTPEQLRSHRWYGANQIH